MARVLFCWELGQGLGHLVRYRGLVGKLIENGHEVFYLARDPDRVRRVNPQAEIHVEQIHAEYLPLEQQIRQPQAASPATLLLNCGFASASELAARARIWIERIETIAPDYIISDHSPTAVFANRFLNYPIVIAGNGFTAPPVENPFRLFQYWRFEPSERSRAFETQLTSTLNDAAALLSMDAVSFAHGSELFDGTQQWLMTFPELDCYGERQGACYLGTFPDTHFGEAFSWPNSSGPKIFGYLNKLQNLEAFADWTLQHELSLCLCGTEFPQHLLERFTPNRVYLGKRPANLSVVFEHADIGISNGPANTVANFALAGIPQLTFPQSIENLMEARRIELLGCGMISMGDNAARVAEKMNALLRNPDYRRAARQMQEKYRHQNIIIATNLMYDKLTLR